MAAVQCSHGHSYFSMSRKAGCLPHRTIGVFKADRSLADFFITLRLFQGILQLFLPAIFPASARAPISCSIWTTGRTAC